jgi:hypothetical protein
MGSEGKMTGLEAPITDYLDQVHAASRQAGERGELCASVVLKRVSADLCDILATWRAAKEAGASDAN